MYMLINTVHLIKLWVDSQSCSSLNNHVRTCYVVYKRNLQNGSQVDTSMALMNWIKLCLSYWLLSDWACGRVYLCLWKKYLWHTSLKAQDQEIGAIIIIIFMSDWQRLCHVKTWRALCQKLATPHHRIWLQKPSLKEPSSLWNPDCQIDSMRRHITWWWVISMTQPWASSPDCPVIQDHTPEGAASIAVMLELNGTSWQALIVHSEIPSPSFSFPRNTCANSNLPQRQDDLPFRIWYDRIKPIETIRTGQAQLSSSILKVLRLRQNHNVLPSGLKVQSREAKRVICFRQYNLIGAISVCSTGCCFSF